MRKPILKIGSKGDTIIEILLAIAVLSLVLSISYGLANRSSQAIRQAQERSEAQKIAEEQLELLRGYFSPEQPWEDENHYRCFNSSGNPTATEADCHRGPDGRYNIINIEQIGNTFTVHMDWPNIRGGTDELSLAYKLPVSGDIPITLHVECDDDIDNGPILDGRKDSGDPDCHTDHNAANLASYDPSIDEEDPPPPVTLTVRKNLAAGGTVSGSGINCGTSCSVTSINVPAGTPINLNVAAAPNYTFNGWTPSSCGSSFGIVSNTTCRANFTHNPPPPRQPLYRCYSIHTGGDFRFVTDHHYGVPGAGSCYPSIHNNAWWIYYEGIAGYVPTDGSYPSADVYGGWNSDRCGGWVNPWPWWDHFYTTNYQEYVNAHYGGWCGETGYQGWSVLSDGSAPGSVPLYRFWHGGVGDHFYTTNWWEGANAGYSYEGIFGWVYTTDD